jgi:ParB-like nuclease domain
MATIAPTAAGGLTLPLARIHVPENVRALNAEHVDALAASIALQGMLVPIVVCPVEADLAATGFDYELVAGFHRVAAADKLGLVEVPAVIRDSGGEQADRAVENITRLQLGPAEPGGIALDASFGRSDDAIASGFGAIPGFAAWLLVAGNTAAPRSFSASHPDQMQHCCSDCDRPWVAVSTLLARRTWCSLRVSRSSIRRARCSTACWRAGARSSVRGC